MRQPTRLKDKIAHAMVSARIDLSFCLALILLIFTLPIPATAILESDINSLTIFDRNGYQLREVLSPQQGHGDWIALSRINPRILECAILAEDKRFLAHNGIDFQAMIRAALQNLEQARLVSGASTITQQVIRNIYHWPRTIFYKLLEVWFAFRLELTVDKHTILENYLNRIPFGNQIFGIEYGAQKYFGKSSSGLTWAEAAFLMAIPKSPTYFNPYRFGSKARARQHWILDQLRLNQRLSNEEYQRALEEELTIFPDRSIFKAPHFCDWVIGQKNNAPKIRTSLDLPLQEEVERIVTGHIADLKEYQVTNAAALVIENRSGQIIAWVGSADYFDEKHDGQYNAVFAKRQPGSTLKPFLYALSLSHGYTPSTVIPDIETVIPTEDGTYTPRNYDNQFHGPVRLRTALACSYNVPAVRVLQDVGVENLLADLHRWGFVSLDQGSDFYGHGLTLGNGEVTLMELTQAYVNLANRGRFVPITYHVTPARGPATARIVPEATAYIITDILADGTARIPAFGYTSPITLPFACAAKTGTSSNFRDNWTVGFTSDYTVAVWVGNFDNKPMQHISGISGAGPIFRDIVLLLHKDAVPSPFIEPRGIVNLEVCALSGNLPGDHCASLIRESFLEGSTPDVPCELHTETSGNGLAKLPPIYAKWLSDMQIEPWRADSLVHKESLKRESTLRLLYPHNGAMFKIDPSVSKHYQSMYFEAVVPEGAQKARWYLNGKFIGQSGSPFRKLWKLQAGKFSLRVEAGGITDSVTFSVEKE